MNNLSYDEVSVLEDALVEYTDIASEEYQGVTQRLLDQFRTERQERDRVRNTVYTVALKYDELLETHAALAALVGPGVAINIPGRQGEYLEALRVLEGRLGQLVPRDVVHRS